MFLWFQRRPAFIDQLLGIVTARRSNIADDLQSDFQQLLAWCAHRLIAESFLDEPLRVLQLFVLAAALFVSDEVVRREHWIFCLAAIHVVHSGCGHRMCEPLVPDPDVATFTEGLKHARCQFFKLIPAQAEVISSD